MSNNEDTSSPALPLFWKIIVFLLPITVLSGALILIPSHIYERSREEVWAWAIWGAVAWTMIILIIIGSNVIYVPN
jgi:hypothetical protein